MFSVEFYKLKHNATSFRPYLKTVQLRVCRFCLLRHCYAKIFLVAVFFLFILRVTACCLRRKEGEFRTFRSYTEEDIFLWVWFNRQEAADSHFSVMLFLWVQDSQVSLWVFFLCVFFSTQFWNMSLIFLAKLYFPTVPLNKKVKYSALRQKGMLDEYI